ncbi:sulfatase-like hydrolase/transferase [Synechococcus sp. AH-558-M21]|nr:sulfatase-like hydrolase/transferase [Synechococcus sp. AH-558-M21]
MYHKQANLLLVTFDQWRGDWTDPVEPVVRLPCLERLAAQGLSARRCYTSSPQCVPARLSWLTGLAPSQLGVTRNCEAQISANTPSIVRDLQKQGWYTELIGKTHWTSHLKPGDLRENKTLIRNAGFDRVMEVAGPRALQIMSCELTDAWKKENVFEEYLEDMKKRYRLGRTAEAWDVRPSVLPNHLYPDIWIADQGIRAIKRMPKNKPWLLWISFVGPHEPFDTPTLWANINKHNLPKFTKRADWINELSNNCELQKSATAWTNKLTEDAIEKCRNDYANNLQLLDDQLGRLTDEVKKREDAGQTAITVTADHGEMLGEHKMLYKGTFLEGSIRVPFLYIPPPQTEEEKTVINRPIALTETFMNTLNNLKKGGKLKTLKKYCRRQKYVTIEFGNELLIIKNNNKLCCNNKGEQLWATNLKKDPNEQKNQLKNDNILSKRKNWIEIRRIAQKEIQRRKEENWTCHKLLL